MFWKIRIMTLAIFIFCGISVCIAEDNVTVFRGLSWGMTHEEVKKAFSGDLDGPMPYTWVVNEGKNSVVRSKGTSRRKNEDLDISGFKFQSIDYYFKDNRLYKIEAKLGQLYLDTRFYGLANLIIEKYGPPTVVYKGQYGNGVRDSIYTWLTKNTKITLDRESAWDSFVLEHYQKSEKRDF